MVKNAHHFNEPNSDIYKVWILFLCHVTWFTLRCIFCVKMASTLKKHIIAKCAELERKYQTVVKTQ